MCGFLACTPLPCSDIASSLHHNPQQHRESLRNIKTAHQHSVHSQIKNTIHHIILKSLYRLPYFFKKTTHTNSKYWQHCELPCASQRLQCNIVKCYLYPSLWSIFNFSRSLGIAFTVDDADSHTTTSGAHGQNMEPLVCFGIVCLDRRKTCKHNQMSIKDAPVYVGQNLV